jgi:hypothetical protein
VGCSYSELRDRNKVIVVMVQHICLYFIRRLARATEKDVRPDERKGRTGPRDVVDVAPRARPKQ